MLPFYWRLLAVTLFATLAHGASINSPDNVNVDDEQFDDGQRSKRSYKRGQTQSQYLNFGQPELDGKAEAEATEGGSRSTVSGSHGMGQAQSQFSSGDCSGCGIGSPVYEYSTGSPDPLTLGNVLPYTDGKPSSMIGLHGTSPGGVFGPDSVGQAGRTGAGVGFTPSIPPNQLGQTSRKGDFTPASTVSGAPREGSSFTPGVGGTEQSGRPGGVRPYAPGSTFIPAASGAGQIGRPASAGAYAPGGAYTPGISGQIGRPGGAFTPETSGQIGRPGGAFTPETSGQIGRPGGAFTSETSGQIGRPGGAFTPETSGQIGRPGGAFTPETSGLRPSGGDSYMPGSAYAPGTSAVGQIGKPGPSFAYPPGTGYSPGASDSAQRGRPGAGSVYGPGISGAEQTGRTGTDDAYSPGSRYSSGPSGLEQTGIQASGGGTYAPSGRYSPETSGVGQAGRSGAGDVYAPGARYTPGTSGTGQVGRPSSYIPGSGYIPGVGYAPSSQAGSPGIGDNYAPGSGYTPGLSSVGQIGRPGMGSAYVPGSGYAPGTGGVGKTGSDNTYAPHGVGTVGLPGTQFGYGPAVGSGGIKQQGEPGFVKPGVTGTGQQARGQDQPPHLIAPPMVPPRTIQGPQIGFGPQTYDRAGQQIPTYIPGASYSVPGAGKQQPPQYDRGSQQMPGYGVDGRHAGSGSMQPGQELTTYGQPGQQIPQTGTFYGPSGGLVPDTVQHIGRQPQQPGYIPGLSGQISGTGGPAHPGPRYSVTGPQQISQQPGQGGVLRPGISGIPESVGGSGQRQPSFQVLPSAGYEQPGSEGQTGAGYQSGGGFGQPGAQQGRATPVSGFVQPGTVFQQGGAATNGQTYQPGYDQRGGDFIQRGYSQPGNVPQVSNLQPVGQPSFGPPSTSTQPGAGMVHRQPHSQQSPFIETAGIHPAAGFDQRGTGIPPSSGSLIPGYSAGYGQQGQPGASGSYPQVPMFGGVQQSGQPNTGVQPVTGLGSQIASQPPSGTQIGAHLGDGFNQYPGSGLSHPGAGQGILPAAMQHGTRIHQGAGFGTGYDTPYGQQPSAQQGVGYGQMGGTPQYGHPGATGTRLPGSAVSQYGQGPQTIVQPGTTYIPGGAPVSGSQQPSGATGGVATGAGGAEDAFSQAESSIGNGQAAASAQGKKNGGTAKTQVQGTYSSSGSFSASAMTSDNDRSASSQVTGGVEGAMSQSQGQGGAAQSQAQVQVNEKTGGTKASSQSGGIIHQSQSEVQANDKGGLADAQSSGPGQTSSQAQIGFRPGQDGEIVRSAGGGQASAQSGAHSGNSQSQIQGTSKYGVSYHGAAQSASGTKEQVATYREQNRDLFNTISQFGGTDAVTDRVDTVYTPTLTSESDIPDLQLKASRTNKEATNSNKLDDDSILTDDEEEEEPYDEYEDEEDYYNENPIKMEPKNSDDKKSGTSSLYSTHTQTSPTQTQQVAVADSSQKYNVVQNQNGRIQSYSSRTTTETVPNGFRGTVNVEKKFHTKSLEPHKAENKLNITDNAKSGHKPRTPDSFVTVTKSITGSMDNSKNPPQDNKNFQSTYYTKSSTCGYFTFSCNIVYGANGRSKICRPKAPTNGKC